MQFSIIIPVYNTASYLEACLDSVLLQSFPQDKIEIVCINDGSTDNSAEILQSYTERYKHLHVVTQSNAGLSAARNVGMRQAKGEYLLFLDSDDILVPDALFTLAHTIRLQTLPDVMAFGSYLWYPEENDRQVPNAVFNHQKSANYRPGMAYLDYFVQSRGWGPSAACFYAYRRAFLLQHALSFPIGLLHEDELFVPQMLTLAQTVCTIPDILYGYRMRTTSIVHMQSEKHSRDKLTISYRLEQFFRETQSLNRTTCRILYSLTNNALLGLRQTHATIPCKEWYRLFRLTDNCKAKIKLISVCWCMNNRWHTLIKRIET